MSAEWGKGCGGAEGQKAPWNEWDGGAARRDGSAAGRVSEVARPYHCFRPFGECWHFEGAWVGISTIVSMGGVQNAFFCGFFCISLGCLFSFFPSNFCLSFFSIENNSNLGPIFLGDQFFCQILGGWGLDVLPNKSGIRRINPFPKSNQI